MKTAKNWAALCGLLVPAVYGYWHFQESIVVGLRYDTLSNVVVLSLITSAIALSMWLAWSFNEALEILYCNQLQGEAANSRLSGAINPLTIRLQEVLASLHAENDTLDQENATHRLLGITEEYRRLPSLLATISGVLALSMFVFILIVLSRFDHAEKFAVVEASGPSNGMAANQTAFGSLYRAMLANESILVAPVMAAFGLLLLFLLKRNLDELAQELTVKVRGRLRTCFPGLAGNLDQEKSNLSTLALQNQIRRYEKRAVGLYLANRQADMETRSSLSGVAREISGSVQKIGQLVDQLDCVQAAIVLSVSHAGEMSSQVKQQTQLFGHLPDILASIEAGLNEQRQSSKVMSEVSLTVADYLGHAKMLEEHVKESQWHIRKAAQTMSDRHVLHEDSFTRLSDALSLLQPIKNMLEEMMSQVRTVYEKSAADLSTKSQAQKENSEEIVRLQHLQCRELSALARWSSATSEHIASIAARMDEFTSQDKKESKALVEDLARLVSKCGVSIEYFLSEVASGRFNR